MTKQHISKYNPNNELGWTEEQWWRYWYDMYHNNVASCTPQSPNVLKHYCEMPERYKAKFMREGMKKQHR